MSISLKGSVVGVRGKMLEYQGVVRERVTLGAEMVDEETMERLNHVSVIDLGRFTTIIDQFELVLGLFLSHVFTRAI